MKTIIAGGRDFNDSVYMEQCLEEHNITEVVCGKAKGADTQGENWGIAHNVPIKEFPAEWNRYGRGAGPIRNEQMGDYAEALIAFWDGRSKGTHNMIKYARNKGLHVTVYNYETPVQEKPEYVKGL